MLKLLLIIEMILFVGSTISVESQKLFELFPDRVEIVWQDKSIIEVTNLRVKKVNKTRLVFGIMNLYESFGNNFLVEMKSLKKQGGEYRYLPYKAPPTPLCDLIIRDRYIYPDLARQSDFPEDPANNCPLVPANYSLNGVSCALKNFPVIGYPSGEYAGELIYHKDDKTVGIYRIYVFINNI